jgi:hypothetical protein
MGAGKVSAIVVLLLSFSILPGSVQAKYSGGSGTPEDPYLISTPEDMNQIGRNYTDWNKCFKLTADINLCAYTGTQFSRIGTDASHAFSGVFDGNGHTISGFTYTAPTRDYIGVFGNNRGTIENVSLVDVNVTGRNYVGGLVGYLEGSEYSDGEISNCNSAGIIRGGDNSRYIGGLVGRAGTYGYGCYINNCYSASIVTGGNGSAYLGGLVGQIVNGEISNCSSTGAVTSGNNSQYLGGLVGGIGSAESSGYCENHISNCYSTGTVTGGDDSEELGGLVGGILSTYNGDDYSGESDISNCYSTGAVTGGDTSVNLGGLVGSNYHSYGYISECYSTGPVTGGYDSDSLGGLVGYKENCDVADCYATGEVAGDYDVGGLVGLIESYDSITTCYSSGRVSGYMFVGGLVGWNNGEEQETTDSFWDTDTSGQSWSACGTGKTTVEMMTESTFTDAGWNFLSTWDIVEGLTYPFFKSGGGTGTPDDPYRIATKADLLAMAVDTSYYDKCFILTADIDMEGQVFTTAIIAASCFTGTFDGNDHKITNFTINGGDDLGLFSCIDYSGSVKNLGLENCSVSGSYYVGGLAGGNDGTISNCNSTGMVSGTYYVGGLVGGNWNGAIGDCYSTGTVTGGGNSELLGGLVGENTGSISNCYSTASVISGDNSYYLGGLVGENWGTISNCNSTGMVSGTYYVGGLVGGNYGSISNCYSTGMVSGSNNIGGLVGYNNGIISSSYFLITSGLDNGLGTPLTDEQMKQQSSFIDWDFNDVWAICEGTNYPRLLWSIPAADFVCPDGVNFADYSFFAQRWLNTDCANNNCDGTDFDFSGTVDIADLAIMCEYWLKGF